VRTVSHVLHEDNVAHLWNGEPLRLWVTDGPGNTGRTLLAVNITGLASD
jgi:hypothetical protein